MIQLTSATKVNRKGEEVDASIYLVHFDSRNLAIIQGAPTIDASGRKKQNVIGYYSSVKHALQKSIDLAVKNGSVVMKLSELVQRIDSLEDRIEELYGDLPSMMTLLKGGEL